MYKRKPEWLKIRLETGENITYMENILNKYSLNSVCKVAKCPNRLECYRNRTATFIILGTVCTRQCSFCNITNGIPSIPNQDEPENVAFAVKKLGLEYVVITSVTRDDLVDGGAEHFYSVTKAIFNRSKNSMVELLVPDFNGNRDSLMRVLESEPTVLNHNMESISRLYGTVRKGADYNKSLKLLETVKKESKIHTKSGIILGLGEKDSEIEVLLQDLRLVDCDLLTMGQYLSPDKNHMEVSEYVTPKKFKYWKNYALDLGFKGVASGPLVRSSYNARSLMCLIS